MFEIIYQKQALKDLKKLHKNQKLLLKYREILNDIKQNPYSQAFKMEKLKYNFQDHFSKRLDQKNRVIYQVLDQKVIVNVISVLGHYED